MMIGFEVARGKNDQLTSLHGARYTHGPVKAVSGDVPAGDSRNDRGMGKGVLSGQLNGFC